MSLNRLQELKNARASEKLFECDARENLIDFSCYIDPAYEVNWHHERMDEGFEALEKDKIDVLIINVRPRSGKTQLITKNGSAWWLGRHPDHQIVAAAYGDTLAFDYGRETRDIINGPEYGRLFPTKLSDDSSAKNIWHTSQGGVFVAAGIGSGITGRGADLLNIDDPHKNWKELMSPTVRKTIIDWFKSVAMKRLMPKGKVCITMTRGHKQDLTGFALEYFKSKGKRVEHIKIPALNEKGESFWPGWWPAKDLEAARSDGAEMFQAIEQQEPVLSSTSMFKREMFIKLKKDEVPETILDVRAWDLAHSDASEADDPDYTAGVKMGKTADGRYVIKDIKRGQWAATQGDSVMIQTAENDGKKVWIGEEQEPAGGKRVIEYHKRMFSDYVFNPKIQVSKDDPDEVEDIYRKQTNSVILAVPVAGQAGAGKFYVVEGAWNEIFLNEVESFPGGVNDDQVVALILAFTMLQGSEPKPRQGVTLRPVSSFAPRRPFS